jgi:lipoprotein-releasing system permease protein
MGGYEWLIGWRYLHQRRRSKIVLGGLALSTILTIVHFGAYLMSPKTVFAFLAIGLVLAAMTFLLLRLFSVFTTVSIVGVILGVAALVVVSSVTSGFQQSFKQKVLGVNAHVLVLKYGLDFSEYREVMKKTLAEPHVRAAAPFVFNEMMLGHGPAVSGVLIKGIEPQLAPKVIDIGEKLTAGKYSDLSVRAPAADGGPPLPAMFIGKELAKKIKAKLGDRVRVVSPKASFDPAAWDTTRGDAPTAHEFRIAGIFYSGFDEYDRRLCYVTLKDGQDLVGAGDVVMGVEIKIDDIDRAQEVSRQMLVDLGGTPYRVIDWEELNHNLFAALKMQKVALVIFLTLIVVVAAFNIVAALTMLVIDKTKEVAIFKAMGMRSSGVARIFQVVGITIGTVGISGGVLLGLLVCLVVERYGYALDPKVYLIDKLPVQIRPEEIVLVAGITLGICFLATIYPSLKAARSKPVDGLRYE